MIDPKNTAYNSLVIIMILLLAAATISLFAPIPENSEVEQLDIIVRTALSSVFGFLISATIKKQEQITLNETGNYQEKSSDVSKEQEQSDIIFNEKENLNAYDEVLQSKIISQMQSTAFKQNLAGKALKSKKRKNLTALNLQIVIIASISFYCLVVLILARNASFLFAANSSTVSTISQFRDFISSGIGALIGLSQKNKTT